MYVGILAEETYRQTLSKPFKPFKPYLAGRLNVLARFRV